MPAEVSDANAGKSKEKKLFSIDLKPRIFPIPTLIEKSNVNIRYPLISPYAIAHIARDEKTDEICYFVEEPKLDSVEQELLKLIKIGLEETINISFTGVTNVERVLDYLEKSVQSILSELGARVSKQTYQKIMYYIYRDSVGLNKIEPLLNDYYIEDIECNGVGVPVYIVHRIFENMRTNIVFDSEEELLEFVEKLAQKCGKYISYAQPLLDTALPDGSRVNATYSSDITTRGPTFTIRKFTEKPLTPTSLIINKTAPAEIFAYLWLAIDNKMNMMFIGETASGKTTLLNAVLHFIPSQARITSIEDTRELNLAHQNWIPAVSRIAFGTPLGEIGLFDLLRETFRQNPDYVVVGEVRGKETFVLFQGMASGHACYSTFHAGSFSNLVRRLETPPIKLPGELIDSLDIVCIMEHIKDQERNIRRVREVDEVLPYTKEHKTNPVLVWDPATDTFVFNKRSIVLEKISKKSGKSVDEIMREWNLRTMFLKALVEKKVFDFEDFASKINLYRMDKKKALEELNIKT
ncbi:MAG: type II/IV secretion system ATPase subunit [Candidatus Woesearchaeota archaeon]